VTYVGWDETWKIRKWGRALPWLEPFDAHLDLYSKLNLGCGTLVFEPKHGWVNMDREGGPGVIEHDMYDIPWPFEDRQFEYVFMSNILEHVCPLKWFDVIEELFRITRDGGHWEIHGPDPDSVDITLQAPTHTGLVGPWSFLGFIITHDVGAADTVRVTSRHRLEPVDCVYDRNRPRKWRRFYGAHVGPITDYHMRKYLGPRLGEFAARVLGRPWTLRLVYRVRHVAPGEADE